MKIPGLRVEVGEIEEILKAANNPVGNAAVIEVKIGHKALIAFPQHRSDLPSLDILSVRDDGVGILLNFLRRTVRQKLPSYMTPVVFCLARPQAASQPSQARPKSRVVRAFGLAYRSQKPKPSREAAVLILPVQRPQHGHQHDRQAREQRRPAPDGQPRVQRRADRRRDPVHVCPRRPPCDAAAVSSSQQDVQRTDRK